MASQFILVVLHEKMNKVKNFKLMTLMYTVFQKLYLFHLLTNSVKNQLVLIIFGMETS